MTEQLSFPGFNAGPPTDRLLFAIVPEPDAAAEMAGLGRRFRTEYGLGGQPLVAERLHITLHHLGDYAGLPSDIVAKVDQAGAAITTHSFEVEFNRAMSFAGRPGNRPFVLRGNDGLAALIGFQRALGAAMTMAGLGRWAESSYTPHVTLLYDTKVIDERTVEPIRWRVREFLLLHSLLGRTQHIPLRRWPLHG